MQRLEVSGAVRPIYESLGIKRLNWYCGSFPGVKRPVHLLTAHLQSVQRSRICGAIPPPPLYALVAWTGKISTLLYLKVLES